MAIPTTTYKAIHDLLDTQGVVLLHRGRAPVNPVNLFDMLVVEGRHVAVKVDDIFVEAMRKLADDSAG